MTVPLKIAFFICSYFLFHPARDAYLYSGRKDRAGLRAAESRAT